MSGLGDPRAAGPDACPEYPGHVRNLLGVLRHQREHMGTRVVCHRIARQRQGLVAEPLTVEELCRRAGRAAAVLAACGVADGARVVLSLSDPHDFLITFFGTLMAGGSAVPLPTVGEAGAPRSFATRVQAVAGDCAPVVAVVEGRERFAAALDAVPAGLVVLEPRDLAAGAGDVPGLPERDPAPAVPAFIQYTSGSTGAPRGVVVTHGNVLANCRAIRDATGYTRADRMVSWLPLHHDMGLVGGLLTSVYCAAGTWLMPPLAFVARPVVWLEAITRFAATLTVAPTFAYGLCARKIPARQLDAIDLSSLRLAYVGAEPIDPATLAAFVERFAVHGLAPTAMYPVYGLAEVTLAAAFPAPGSPVRTDTVDRRRLALEGDAVPAPAGEAGSVTFVSVGRALPGHALAVVDPESGAALAERRVGELVVQGDSVSPGYFADAPAGAPGPLRTGDLGYVADGHHYVVDRIKDLVIINGRNYAPSDIERTAGEVAGVRRGRIVAFSSRGASGSEELHVVAEASPASWRRPREIARDLQRTIRRDLGLAAASVTIVGPGTLERTSSGKLKRRACVDAHRAGTLRTLRTRAQLFAYRLARWRTLLRHRGRQVFLAARSVL